MDGPERLAAGQSAQQGSGELAFAVSGRPSRDEAAQWAGHSADRQGSAGRLADEAR